MLSQRNALRAEFKMMMKNKSKIKVFTDMHNLQAPIFLIDGVKTTRSKHSTQVVFWVPQNTQRLNNGMILTIDNSDDLWEVVGSEDDIVGKNIIKRIYYVNALN